MGKAREADQAFYEVILSTRSPACDDSTRWRLYPDRYVGKPITLYQKSLVSRCVS